MKLELSCKKLSRCKNKQICFGAKSMYVLMGGGGWLHCIKSVLIGTYSGPYFPAFGLITDQNNSEYGHFSRSAN